MDFYNIRSKSKEPQSQVRSLQEIVKEFKQQDASTSSQLFFLTF